MALTLTLTELSKRAMRTLNLIQPNEDPSADDFANCRMVTAELIDSWNIQALTVLAQQRDVYDLTANKGTPTNPYTYGPGGDFDTGTRPRPDVIRTANLLLNTTTPYPVEIPLAILTDDMYAANPIKALTNAQPQTLYYQRSVPLGLIQLWNVPNTNQNDLVLYTDLLTPQFAGNAVAYVCPPGYAKAFRLCVAKALLPFYGSVSREIAGNVVMDADEALREIKMANAPMQDLSVDPAFISDTHGTYVIQTDEGA